MKPHQRLGGRNHRRPLETPEVLLWDSQDFGGLRWAAPLGTPGGHARQVSVFLCLILLGPLHVQHELLAQTVAEDECLPKNGKLDPVGSDSWGVDPFRQLRRRQPPAVLTLLAVVLKWKLARLVQAAAC